MIVDVNKGEHLGIVTLDGKRVLYPQVVDDEKCIVRAPLVDDKGNPVFDYGTDNFALVERQGTDLKRLLGSDETWITVEQKSIFAVASQFNLSLARSGELSANWKVMK